MDMESELNLSGPNRPRFKPIPNILYEPEFILKTLRDKRGVVPTSNDPFPFKCPVPDCDKMYKNRNGLKYHAYYGHSMPKQFQCPCGKIYLTHQGLMAHLKVHNENNSALLAFKKSLMKRNGGRNIDFISHSPSPGKRQILKKVFGRLSIGQQHCSVPITHYKVKMFAPDENKIVLQRVHQKSVIRLTSASGHIWKRVIFWHNGNYCHKNL